MGTLTCLLGDSCARYCCSDADCGTGVCAKTGDAGAMFPAVPDLGICQPGSGGGTGGGGNSGTGGSGGAGGAGGGGGAAPTTSSSGGTPGCDAPASAASNGSCVTLNGSLFSEEGARAAVAAYGP